MKYILDHFTDLLEGTFIECYSLNQEIYLSAFFIKQKKTTKIMRRTNNFCTKIKARTMKANRID